MTIIHYDKNWQWEKIRRDIDRMMQPLDVCGICCEEPFDKADNLSGWMTCGVCNPKKCKAVFLCWTASNCATCPWCRATQGEPTSPATTVSEQRVWLARAI